MRTYKVTVYDYFFNQEFSGEFDAETMWEAEDEARVVYAQELGTQPEEIDVVEVIETEKAGAPTTAHPQAKNKTLHHEEEQVQSIAQDAQKINLGSIYTTPSVSEEMGRNDWFRYDIHAAVGRFSHGDWGEGFSPEAEIHDQVLDAGADKIIGIYDTQAGRVWVMAEPVMAATTILFEGEY